MVNQRLPGGQIVIAGEGDFVVLNVRRGVEQERGPGDQFIRRALAGRHQRHGNRSRGLGLGPRGGQLDLRLVHLDDVVDFAVRQAADRRVTAADPVNDRLPGAQVVVAPEDDLIVADGRRHVDDNGVVFVDVSEAYFFRVTDLGEVHRDGGAGVVIKAGHQRNGAVIDFESDEEVEAADALDSEDEHSDEEELGSTFGTNADSFSEATESTQHYA